MSAVNVRASSRTALAAALCALVAAGCGKDIQRTAGEAGGAGPGGNGAVAVATKNTTRLGGGDPVADAAAVARAVYPGLTAKTRPEAVVVVDEREWPAALAASTLAGRPLHAPLLFSEGGTLPRASAEALSAVSPIGAARLGGAQAVSIGDAPAPGGLSSRTVRASDPAALAVAIERLASALRGRPPDRVIVTAMDVPPAMTAPAAGLAAQSGAPVLFVQRTRIPQATADELRRLRSAAIYVVGPTTVVSDRVTKGLQGFGHVTRIGDAGPAGNAVAVARFSDGAFGWGVVEPGHGLVFANETRPLDGPAAAPLSATGDYGPLLLLEGAEGLPGSVAAYLSDLQPGTPPSGPVHGVYNHGWLIGDESAISATTQARIDASLQIAPKEATEAEAAP